MKASTRANVRMTVAALVIAAVSVYVIRRQVTGAMNDVRDGVGGFFGGIGDGIGNAWNAVGNGVGAGVAAFGDGVQAIAPSGIDPVTGEYVPFGAVANPPPGTTYNVPWYLGGGTSDVFNPDGSYSGPGVWGSNAVRTAEQADVRRLDNAIANGSYVAPRTGFMSFFPNYAS